MISTSMLEHILGKLAEDKYVNEKWDNDINDFIYEVTLKGQEKIINIMREDKDSRIKYFMLLINVLCKMENIPVDQAFVKAMLFFKREMNINISDDFQELKDKGVIDKDDLIILKDMYNSL